MKEQLEALAREWHEAGRALFDKRCPNLIYDTYAPKQVIEKNKYFYLDQRGSGFFMVEKTSGNIYGIKAYGVINRRKLVGHVSTVTGDMLFRQNGF